MQIWTGWDLHRWSGLAPRVLVFNNAITGRLMSLIYDTAPQSPLHGWTRVNVQAGRHALPQAICTFCLAVSRAGPMRWPRLVWHSHLPASGQRTFIVELREFSTTSQIILTHTHLCVRIKTTSDTMCLRFYFLLPWSLIDPMIATEKKKDVCKSNGWVMSVEALHVLMIIKYILDTAVMERIKRWHWLWKEDKTWHLDWSKKKKGK